ncbi:hypothetical protein CMI43_01380 [Candidatus Pacearchaeota archaeon]|nr:hypothetical protein [Candidatus Pacearchaeota archaeon]
MKTWLKGGLIGGTLGEGFFILISIIISAIKPPNEVLRFILVYIFHGLPLMLFEFVSRVNVLNVMDMMMTVTNIGWIVLIIFYFIIGAIFGALIGWIYGKIKSKKQQPIQTQPLVQTK